MHIPDGLIGSPHIWAGCLALSLPIVAVAARGVFRDDDERIALRLGLTGAFIFAVQLFNFPVPGGTSGHLIGGVLACLLVGGGAGIVVMSLVLLVQALLFGDGGITSLGANILNMAIVGGFLPWLAYQVSQRWVPRSFRSPLLALWCAVGVLSSAALASLQIGLGGIVPLQLTLPIMLVLHLPIAITEALGTVSVVSSVERLNPQLLTPFPEKHANIRSIEVPAIAAFFAIGLLVLASVAFASDAPDGLAFFIENVNLPIGDAWISAPFAGYQLPGTAGVFSQAAAALLGTVVTAGTVAALYRLNRRISDTV